MTVISLAKARRLYAAVEAATDWNSDSFTESVEGAFGWCGPYTGHIHCHPNQAGEWILDLELDKLPDHMAEVVRRVVPEIEQDDEFVWMPSREPMRPRGARNAHWGREHGWKCHRGSQHR